MNIGTAFILIRNGASIKQIDGAGGIPITRIETIANKVIDRNRMGYANIYNEDKYSSYFLRDGDILMSHINSIQHLGKVAIYHPKNENEKIIHGMNLLVLRANQKLMDNQFAYFYFSSESFLRKLPRITKKSVNQASFTVSELKKIDIPCPSLSQQRRIANILSIVQNLCDKRNQQLRTFDELVKSRFLELFGDPNDISILSLPGEKKFIEDVCDGIYGGGTPSKSHKEYYTGNIPWVTPKDMKTLSIDDSQNHINSEAIENSTAKLIPKRCVLMVIRSGILKHTLPVAINNVEVTINQDMKAFVPSSLITPEYLLYTFKLMEKSILSKVRGVTADNIEFSEFRKRRIFIPPIELQTQFVDFVLSIDKSLMQTYFG